MAYLTDLFPHFQLVVSLLGVFSFAAFLAIRCRTLGQRPLGYPPGPPTLPFIGNLHQRWAEEYGIAQRKLILLNVELTASGDVYSLILGSQTLVVLNSGQAVKDLFDRRGNIYSDRPDAYIGQDIASGGMRVVLMKYGVRWRAARKLIHSLLSHAASQNFTPFQDLESKQMLNDLLNTPQDFLNHLRRYSNAVTTSMLYGWRTSTYEDPALQQLFSEFEDFTKLLQRPEAGLLDAFPILRWLPDFMVPIKRKARSMHKQERELYLGHWQRAKQGHGDKTIPPCFSVGLIEAQEKEGLSDIQAAYLVGNILEAGSDTTSNILYAFIQAMLLYPDVQTRARKEIEKACGEERLPSLTDKDRLPYVRCLMKESLRWMPTTILGGLPHSATVDDTYKEFVIPKGATVVNNTWTINMDPRRADNPREFNPDRYLDDDLSLFDSAMHKDPAKRDHFTFGSGRRVCPGIHVVENSLFLSISRFLWVFEVSPMTKPDGQKVLPDPGQLTQGVICRPVEYEAKIVPYNTRREAVVKAAWAKDETELLYPSNQQWRVEKFPLR